jgi:hypothetical protein
MSHLQGQVRKRGGIQHTVFMHHEEEKKRPTGKMESTTPKSKIKSG